MTVTEIILTRDGVRYASTFADIPPGLSMYTLSRIESGNSATYYAIEIVVDPEQSIPGWRTGQIQLRIDNQKGAGGARPISWYVGEPTDWATGIVRFPFHDWRSEKPRPSEIWVVHFRRCR